LIPSKEIRGDRLALRLMGEKANPVKCPIPQIF
jgi:hypothetical protein